MAETPANSGADQARPTEGWRVIGPPRALLGTIGGGVGILTPIYLGANTDLAGFRFIVAIVLAAMAIALLFEGTHRARAGKRWQALSGVGVGAGLASLLIAFVPSQGEADAGEGKLRFSIRPTAPKLFHVALRRPIPLPAPQEGWAQLRQRGAIDVGDSHFHLVLANEGSEPISILNIHAEVLGSEPMPRGTDAIKASQGDEGLGQLTALLPNGKRGSVGPIYDSSARTVEPSALHRVPSYFETKYILLKPGEVYPATLTVKSDTPRTITYRMVAEGETAERQFTVKTRTHQLVGRFDDPSQRRFTRYYEKGYLLTDCTPTPDNPWVDARHTARSKACPHGLGRSYEIPLKEPARYPPRKFSLRLGLTPGKQSATVSGVVVGSKPAAAPRSGVVLPLLRSLGAWTTCYKYSPSTGYWMARWDRWNLDMIFASEGASDCTPASSAAARTISLSESRAVVHTDLGPIELGAPAAWLPPPVAEILTAEEENDLGRELVAPGVSPCDPSRLDPARTQLDRRSPGGIVALYDYFSSNELLSLTTTLPSENC